MNQSLLLALAGSIAIAAPLTARADATRTEIIPLPVYATLPNEGNTYGVMPVFLVVESESSRTRSIIAPSVSWNSTIELSGTFRLYHYPGPTRTLTLIASASTHVNRNLFFQYADLPTEPGRLTTELFARVERSIFFRFFGLGPDTRAEDESSHTRVAATLWLREGVNVARYLNLGARLEVRADDPERVGVTGLPLTQDRFPAAPGIDGAAALLEGISLRLDTREQADYSATGFSSEISAALAQGLSGADNFGKLEWHTKLLVQEARWVQGAARLFVGYTLGSRVPFYYRYSLGGSSLLRGFTEDRFIDNGAWEAEVEQRIRAFQTHIFGVTADWRADPFVALGQVFDAASQMADHVRLSAGVGFRAFVSPNVLGRVDVAYGGEGINVYVVLGYPY